MIVNLAGDVRWSGQHTQPATFLGRTYNFSATWVSLAALTGAPVVPVFCQMQREGTYHVEFRPRFHVPADAPKTGQALHFVQEFLRIARRPGAAPSRQQQRILLLARTG